MARQFHQIYASVFLAFYPLRIGKSFVLEIGSLTKHPSEDQEFPRASFRNNGIGIMP